MTLLVEALSALVGVVAGIITWHVREHRRGYVSPRELEQLRSIAETRMVVTIETRRGREVVAEVTAQNAYLIARWGGVGDYGQPWLINADATLWVEYKEGSTA